MKDYAGDVHSVESLKEHITQATFPVNIEGCSSKYHLFFSVDGRSRRVIVIFQAMIT